MHKYHANVDATTITTKTIVVEAENDVIAYDKISHIAAKEFPEHDTVDIGDIMAGDGTEGEGTMLDSDLNYIPDSNDEQPEVDLCCD